MRESSYRKSWRRKTADIERKKENESGRERQKGNIRLKRKEGM